MSSMWEGGLVEGIDKDYKIVRCMKPDRGKRSNGFTKDGEFYYGKMVNIATCIRCEARVRLEEKIIRIVDENGIPLHNTRPSVTRIEPKAKGWALAEFISLLIGGHSE